MGLSDLDGGQTSVVNSASLSPSETGGQQDTSRPAPSPNSLLVAATHNMASGAVSSSVPSASNTPNPDDVPQSHPMTASTSTSSHQSAKEATNSSSQAAAVPAAAGYGTRSRNKPASSRPNYAEDVEMEIDQPTAQTNGTRASPPASITPSHSRQSPSANSSKRAPSISGGTPTPSSNGWASVNNNTAPTAPIPGTSTFSANPNGNVPKKRKAAQNSANVQGSLPQAAQTQTVSRRANGSAATIKSIRETNMYSFENTGAILQNGDLVADDGTTFSMNDHVYLICEPPGDPYYLGRIMEFRTKITDDANSPVEGIRINWVYRPRDVSRFSNDTRLVYATMHSDICPLTSLRGKCIITHKSDFDDLEDWRKKPDHFYFTQAFDRFIHRWYEVIPVRQVINVPELVKKALDERWKYIVVEASKVKELTSDAKRCKRCQGYCATNDSVDCAVCRNTYHMNCVSPPLLKKPSRGFAWACGPCSRAQERRLEARRTPVIGGTPNGDDEEHVEEEEEEAPMPTTTAASPAAPDDRPATDAEIAHAKLWTMRYLGIHCRVEDALQYDDRAIYPRASSRLGPKHQANTANWYGRPVELVKSKEIKRKYLKAPGGKKDSNRLTKETQQALEADRVSKSKRPPYMQDEPFGYVARGEDHPNNSSANTAKLLFKMPSSERGLDDSPTNSAHGLEAYMKRAKKVAGEIGIDSFAVDFLDRALYLYQQYNYDADIAIRHLKKTDPVGKWPEDRWEVRKDLRDPKLSLTTEEKKRFEEGVSKYGSELRSVRLHVKTGLTHADTVRYWYYWKKTPKGHDIWGSYGGRKNTKKLKAEAKEPAAAKLLDDIAHDQDDSSFDNDKIHNRGRKMCCKYCNTRHSRVWRRAPGVAPGQTVLGEGRGVKRENLVLALCGRCARLWRRYAIKWENMEEVIRKLTQVGSKSFKKKLDPELLKELELMNTPREQDYQDVQSDAQSGSEPAKKKARTSLADDSLKKKTAPPAPPPRPPTPPIEPTPAQFRQFPCFVCDAPGAENDEILICRDCRLTVHRRCYGQPEQKLNKPWSCDMCSNDRKVNTGAAVVDSASYDYTCVLCPIQLTQRELVEVPKTGTTKKKTDREKEKERLEKENAIKFAENYKQGQKERGKPLFPREALKRTADNNWVHVSCSLFMPEIKYSNADKFETAEGIPSALNYRKELACTLCNDRYGAVVSCHTNGCNTTFHVTCAMQTPGCKFGFDITPVKSSRRDSTSVVTLGAESGAMAAAIWCSDHAGPLKTIVHPINEKVEGHNLTAIQLFAHSFKQADLTLTGTTRRANQLDDYTKLAATSDNRRASTSAGRGRTTKGTPGDNADKPTNGVPEKKCVTCGVTVAPKWYFHEKKKSAAPAVGGSEDVVMRDASPVQEVPVINGLKQEPGYSRESSMRVESLLTNGAPSPHVDKRAETPARPSSAKAKSMLTPAPEPEGYECHKCNHRRRHPPPPREPSPVPTEVEKTIEEPIRSPTGPQPVQQPWAPISDQQGPPPPPQSQQHVPPHAPWPPHGRPEQPGPVPVGVVGPAGPPGPPYNGPPPPGQYHGPPPQGAPFPPQDAAYPRREQYPPPEAHYAGGDAKYAPSVQAQPPPHVTHQAPPQGYPHPTGPPPPGPPSRQPIHTGYPPPLVPPPHHHPGPQSGMQPHSPGIPPPHHQHPPPRHSESPYTGPQPHQPPPRHIDQYGHHHASPTSHHGSPVPSGLHRPPPGPPGPPAAPHIISHGLPITPQLMHSPPTIHPPQRSAGASTSASLRNLLE